MADARFEDGAVERPIRLKAETVDDLVVLSTLLQDAVSQVSDISWLAKKRRLVMLLNRFRWEDHKAASRAGRPFERVQSLLTIESALAVKGQDVDPSDNDTVLELLGLEFDPSDDPAGRVILTFAGDGAIAVDVECLDVALQDVSRPYIARSQKLPHHPEKD